MFVAIAMTLALVTGAGWLVSAAAYRNGYRVATLRSNGFIADERRDQYDCAVELYNVEDRLTRCLSGVRYSNFSEQLGGGE